MAKVHHAAAPTLVWFRDDLRLADNPALIAAAETGRPVVCLFILDDASPGLRPIGAASRFWLHHSLESLAADLASYGQRLVVKRGAAAKVVPAFAKAIGAAEVVWNRRYGHMRAIDDSVAAKLKHGGIASRGFKASLIAEPDEIRSRSGGPFRVFSAFHRALLQHGEPRAPLPAPNALIALTGPLEAEPIDSLGLLPTAPDWSAGIRQGWSPGEAGAAARLAALSDKLDDYAAHRDEPAADATTRLSPHLRFGEVSPFQVVAAAHGTEATAGKFLSEVAWREFAYHTLESFPTSRPPISAPNSTASPTPSPIRTTCGTGGAAIPATRSSTPACANCG
jgi:deoxyribodipyrimidine photo-lyase